MGKIPGNVVLFSSATVVQRNVSICSLMLTFELFQNVCIVSTNGFIRYVVYVVCRTFYVTE